MKRFLAMLGTLPILALAGLMIRKFIIDPMELVFLVGFVVLIAVGVLSVFCVSWLVEDFKKRKSENKP